jgi:hypothetical protein
LACANDIILVMTANFAAKPFTGGCDRGHPPECQRGCGPAMNAAPEKARLRLSPVAEPFVTDNGNRILNCGNHSPLRRHCNCPLCLPKC